MEPNHPRRATRVEMAAHGIAHRSPKLLEGVRLCEDRLAEGARRVSTFGRLFDDEDQLVHQGSSYAPVPAASPRSGFAFAVTPRLLAQRVVYATVMGLAGGCSRRAARVPIAAALGDL